MAQTGSLEDAYFHLASLAWLVTNKDKFGWSRHSFSRSSPLCGRLWWRWVCPTFVPLLRHVWFSLATSSDLDWFFDSGCSQPLRSFCSVHLFSWRPQGPTVLSAACLTCLCLGCVEWEKMSCIRRFKGFSVSAIGQSQGVFIPVVESD
jgi:hypothetical protein